MREPRGTPRSGRSPEGPKSRSRAKVTTNDHFGAEVESTAFDREDARRASAPRTAPGVRSPARRDRDFAREPTLARAPVCPRGGRRTRATRCIPEPVSVFLAETPSHRHDPSGPCSRRRIARAVELGFKSRLFGCRSRSGLPKSTRPFGSGATRARTHKRSRTRRRRVSRARVYRRARDASRARGDRRRVRELCELRRPVPNRFRLKTRVDRDPHHGEGRRLGGGDGASFEADAHTHEA